MRKISWIMGVVLLSMTLFSFTQLSTLSEVPFPAGYRTWVHVKSNILGPEHANVKYRGYNHIYANDKAYQGYQTGTFPDGSVLVFDILETNAANNMIGEGKHVFIDVMMKDAVKYASTGGWGYAEFEPDGSVRKLPEEQITKCYTCHSKQPDFVFSEFRK
jgi:hypothetical protein